MKTKSNDNEKPPRKLAIPEVPKQFRPARLKIITDNAAARAARAAETKLN